MFRIERVTATPLNVPLIDPFVIASGRIDVTRAVLVEACVTDTRSGARAVGFGEAATLPPVTHEDERDVLDAVQRFALDAAHHTFDDPAARSLRAWLDGDATLGIAAHRPCARAGVESALFDAALRTLGTPMYAALNPGREAARTMVTDITIPIHAPEYMGELATAWRAQGFRCFKVKVGLDRATDLAALRAIRTRVPDALFRLDANGGYGARDALGLYADATRDGCVVECFEQPCARDDEAGMALVTRELPVTVVADESARDLDDLARIVDRRLAGGVNLKLVKMHGPLRAAEFGARARDAGLALMCGAMVETRLGLTAAAHVCAALGGAEYVDLDTAWLLRHDPFVGGYAADGPTYTLPTGAGLAIDVASRAG